MGGWTNPGLPAGGWANPRIAGGRVGEPRIARGAGGRTQDCRRAGGANPGLPVGGWTNPGLPVGGWTNPGLPAGGVGEPRIARGRVDEPRIAGGRVGEPRIARGRVDERRTDGWWGRKVIDTMLRRQNGRRHLTLPLTAALLIVTMLKWPLATADIGTAALLLTLTPPLSTADTTLLTDRWTFPLVNTGLTIPKWTLFTAKTPTTTIAWLLSLAGATSVRALWPLIRLNGLHTLIVRTVFCGCVPIDEPIKIRVTGEQRIVDWLGKRHHHILEDFIYFAINLERVDFVLFVA